MYLYARQYVSGWNHSGDDEKDRFNKIVETIGAEDYTINNSPSLTVEITVAYWRKANAIHQWFVENVQGGEDECKPHQVSVEQLRELRNLCKTLLNKLDVVDAGETMPVLTISDGGIQTEERPARTVRNPAVVEETLPPSSGFFFGSTDIDEWYVRDLELTVEQLDRVLLMVATESNDRGYCPWEFEYQSSW